MGFPGLGGQKGPSQKKSGVIITQEFFWEGSKIDKDYFRPKIKFLSLAVKKLKFEKSTLRLHSFLKPKIQKLKYLLTRVRNYGMS
jgi:hypothetical protein